MKNLFLTKDEQAFIKELKEIIVKFDNYLIVKNDKKYENLTRELTLENNDIINDKKIVVSSVEIKKKVLYCLYVQMKHNLSNLIDYKYKKYVDNFYTSSKDFKTSNTEQNIFYTMKEIRLYMIPIVNPYKINYEIPEYDDFSFYYKNPNIDEETLIYMRWKMNTLLKYIILQGGMMAICFKYYWLILKMKLKYMLFYRFKKYITYNKNDYKLSRTRKTWK
jgi:hypothetical protein